MSALELRPHPISHTRPSSRNLSFGPSCSRPSQQDIRAQTIAQGILESFDLAAREAYTALADQERHAHKALQQAYLEGATEDVLQEGLRETAAMEKRSQIEATRAYLAPFLENHMDYVLKKSRDEPPNKWFSAKKRFFSLPFSIQFRRTLIEQTPKPRFRLEILCALGPLTSKEGEVIETTQKIFMETLFLSSREYRWLVAIKPQKATKIAKILLKKEPCLALNPKALEKQALQGAGIAAELLEKEYMLSTQCSHPNVLLMEKITYRGNKQTLVTRYLTPKCEEDLFDFFIMHQKNFSLAKRLHILEQIAMGLSELHKHGICHNDLKPENILIARDGKTAKIFDFGLSCSPASDGPLYPAGSLGYIAPEVLEATLKKEPYNPDISNDIWSFGALCIAILFHSNPFLERQREFLQGKNRDFFALNEIINKIPRDLFMFVHKEGCFHDPKIITVLPLLGNLLHQEPSFRPNITQVVEMLSIIRASLSESPPTRFPDIVVHRPVGDPPPEPTPRQGPQTPHLAPPAIRQVKSPKQRRAAAHDPRR